jgi:tRNA-dihydrouridine synthase B
MAACLEDWRDMKIGGLSIDGNVFLAPMAGVSDLAFRVLAKNFGAVMSYSEMISAKGMHYESRNTKALLASEGEPGPIGVQLFGSEPDIIAETVKRLNETDFALIDINMGCPAPKIVKNGEGSALMKDPELAGRIVRAAARISEKPITVKIRKGWSAGSVNAVLIARVCEENGASAVTVHGRTREQQYSGQADWDIIAEVAAALKIPVIGNGDIKSGQDALRMMSDTGCAAVMIGRAACGNPWIFREAEAAIQGRPLPKPPNLSERMAAASAHLSMLAANKGEYLAVREMRRHLSHYISGMPGAGKIREKVVACESLARMEDIIRTVSGIGTVSGKRLH